MVSNNHISTKIKLRDLQLPEDYKHIAQLFNSIQPGSATVEALEEEDRHIPQTSTLTLNENGLLSGFGRIRVLAENTAGQVIGFGSSWRAPWSDPGELASTFCVHPDYQRQGVGGLILSHLEDWAASHKASVLLSEVKDWIPGSLPFAQKHGFLLDAHIFELRLDVNTLDVSKLSDTVHKLQNSGITFITLADIAGEVSEQKLYDLYVETSKDNPGQSGNLPAFPEWRKDALPENYSKEKWVFIALDGDRFIGVSTLFSTEETGVMYTDYTGVSQHFRGRGIAKALKLLSIQEAISEGAHTMTTETEAGNEAMQKLNRGLGYVPGKGHYRICKPLL
ncbi:GNAT family N-acetyltransferase [Neobacillus niacini]|uniref:GNAT family N-acetyltransferase n=1 Tax=Neobacillus niacini TaxID=86668 RepID=UPI0007ABC38F|nr:GNAT family N-acetyltransferase [Neobacillus niacini]MEC1524157.1 GNAT family N-acetyltransferase [Neobacillus niacini]